MSETLTRDQLIEQAWAASEEEIVPGADAPDTDGLLFPTREEASAPAPAPEAKPAEPAVTKETLDEKPSEVAPSIREFLRAQRKQEPKEPEGLELEVRELRAALAEIRNAGKPVERPNEMQQVLQQLQALQQRETERIEREQQEEAERLYKERERVLRSGVVKNLALRKDEFPALFALGQEENVVNELFTRLSNDEDASDYGVASEYEASLHDLYKKLHAVLGKSEETPRRSDAKPTLSNALVGMVADEDVSGLSREQLIERAWIKANS